MATLKQVLVLLCMLTVGVFGQKGGKKVMDSMSMRSAHLYFTEDTYKLATRQELIDRVKSVLKSAAIEYSTLGAVGFNETSNYLTSYIKVIIKNVDDKPD